MDSAENVKPVIDAVESIINAEGERLFEIAASYQIARHKRSWMEWRTPSTRFLPKIHQTFLGYRLARELGVDYFDRRVRDELIPAMADELVETLTKAVEQEN